MILALAGRRIDEVDADYNRFPLKNVPHVREQLKAYFENHDVKYVVCSAACGADLIALEIAGESDINRKIILPTKPGLFKESSVVDRPGDWGNLFDEMINQVQKEKNLIVLDLPVNEEATYIKTNTEIIHQTVIIKSAYKVNEPLKALVIWDGKARDASDITFNFIKQAKKNKIIVDEILTQ